MTHPNAVLAALVIFNGYKLSPVLASPCLRYQHIGPEVHPRFNQCAAYLDRFFSDASTALDFAPYEQLGETVAVASWIRGAAGFLQHALHQSEGMDIPNCEDVDPAEWFADLEGLAHLYQQYHSRPGLTAAAAKVQEKWEEPDAPPHHKDSHQYKTRQLYWRVRGLQTLNALLTDPHVIGRARKKVEKSS